MPTDPTGSVVRNAIALRRFENSVLAEIERLFTLAGDGLRDAIVRIDPTQVTSGWARRRVVRLNGAAETILADTYRDLAKLAEARIVGVGEVESEYALRLLERMASGADVRLGGKVIGQRFWRSILKTDPIQGAVMKDWWAGQERATAFAFRRQVQIGMANGETTAQMIRRVRGSFVKRGVYSGGVMQTSTRQAGALVRTAVNQIATQAHFETFKANDDITREYQWVSTLDGRTSEICMGLDGQVFKYGEGPTPPAHFNCRSTIVPVVDFEGLGLTPPSTGMRAASGGPVRASTDYPRWLRRQSKTRQDSILGPGRAALFRSGKLDLRDLVRTDGTSYTLDQLREAVG
jgi:SPP1 gp7 family putative phage head morphogenesis protein